MLALIVHNINIKVILISIIFAIFGLIIGSFLNSLIWRLADLESLVKGRSQCPHCQKTLGFWDLIPLLSFVFLLGKCRYCGKKISWQYPFVEFITATIFVLIYLIFGISVYSGILVVIFSGLIVIAVYDIQKMLIPDKILISIAIIIFLYRLIDAIFKNSFSDFGWAFVGAAIFGGIILALFALSRGKWMGFGDIKLAAFLGFILGFPEVLVGFFVAFLAGGLISLILIAAGRKHLKDKVPFAPFIIFGFTIALFWGNQLLSWYLNIGT